MTIAEVFDALLARAHEAADQDPAGGLTVVLTDLGIDKDEIDAVMARDLQMNVEVLQATGPTGIVPLLIEAFAAGAWWERNRG